jgi:serine/threonine protein kinase, bacterial
MIRYTSTLITVALLAAIVSGMFGCGRKEWISPSAVVDSAVVSGSSPAGLVNGQDTAARFDHPFALALDAAGNLYIADQGNSVIRKMDPTGLVSTYAGVGHLQGSANGQDSVATFNKPFGVVADAAGNLYVADAGNNMIRTISPAGMVSTYAGKGPSGSINGYKDTSTFSSPLGVALDAGGNMYVADYGNNLIRRISAAGVVSTLAGTGAAGADDGNGAQATFNLPEGVAADAAGNVYVADNGNNLIRKISPAGVVSTFAGSGLAGSANGAGAAASFHSPFGLATDAAGNVYVADSGNNLIRKITPDGNVSTFAGSGKKGAGNGSGAAASFNIPSGLAIDAAGNVFVADENNNQIRKITTAGTVSTVAVKGLKTSPKLH